MSAVEESSVAPPGWKDGQSVATYAAAAMPAIATGPVTPVAAPLSPVAEPVAEPRSPAAQPVAEPLASLSLPLSTLFAEDVQPAADAAVRWRIRAATVDNLIVYAVDLLLCLVFGWQALNLANMVFVLVLGVLYHSVLESSGGQTIGKRRYGIRVVSVHGGPATSKGIALRSLLRTIDALPFSYLFGLISMVRTGPERRQRIGDVVGETRVIAVAGRAASRGTPSWLLSTATAFALAFSCVAVYGVVDGGSQSLSSSRVAQLISGCVHSGGQVNADCQCLLHQLNCHK